MENSVGDDLLDFPLDLSFSMENSVGDDLIDFPIDDGEGEGTINSKGGATFSSSSMEPTNLKMADFDRQAQPTLFPEFVEEELEWLSNNDAFPPIETCLGILSDDLDLFSDIQSSLWVLDTRSNKASGTSIASCCKVPTTYPVGARNKRRRRANFSNFPFPWLARVNRKKGNVTYKDGIKCMHCQTDETPQWRAGPMGPKTLCNACGVRYKSGWLVQEYRPANSPTFCSALHSNSQKKVMEMRRQKQQGTIY